LLTLDILGDDSTISVGMGDSVFIQNCCTADGMKKDLLFLSFMRSFIIGKTKNMSMTYHRARQPHVLDNLANTIRDINIKFIYFNCACTKLIQTPDSLNIPGATIPGAYARGIMLTGYPTPERPCRY
jgi:hypothetical protein